MSTAVLPPAPVRRAAYTALAVSLVHIVFGAIVRISGSGMGCGDNWPKCHGYWFPPFERMDLIIEVMHRYLAIALFASIAWLVLAAWRARSDATVGGSGGVWNSARLALVLWFAPALFGAVTVFTGNPAWATVVHKLLAATLVAVLTAATIRAGGLGGTRILGQSGTRKTVGSATSAAVGALLVVLMGGLTAKIAGAAVACAGFPLCGEGSLGGGAQHVQLTHRLLAYALVLQLISLPFVFRKRGEPAPLVNAAWLGLGLGILQITWAAWMVLGGFPGVVRSLHQATGMLIWVTAFAMTYLARIAAGRTSVPAQQANTRVVPGAGRGLMTSVPVHSPDDAPLKATVPVPPDARHAEPTLSRDLISLTKPRIISLLLVTTIAPMYAAGSPSWLTVLVVAIGGYLMAGGANAVNMYIDFDIDDVMARTRLRPIPSGRMSRTQVLAFGVACATFATWLLAHFVNVLTAGLALAGFYFYVFIYTRWLKRSSPQNIVIGGAAGAFPPLVGWAAVTGSLDISALCLFLIVFYWTPPHFWALALLKQVDYTRARVPMAPLVWGERETMNQMVWYTIILIVLTLLPVLFSAFGLTYLLSALVLNGLLLRGVLRMRRAAVAGAPWSGLAWWVYKYTLLYLALLFVSMAVDRAIG